jgi:hypothetical protein
MYTVPACTDRICTGDSARWTAEYGPAWRSIIAVWVAVSIPKMITLEQPTGSMRKLSISALPAATGTGTGSYIKGAPRQGLTRKGSWAAPRAVADLGPRRRSTSLLPEPQALVVSDARPDELTPACTPPPPPAAVEQLSNSFHGSAAAAVVPLCRMSSEGNSDKHSRKQSLDIGMRKLAAAWVRLSAEESKKAAPIKELSRRSSRTDVAVAPEKPLAPATAKVTTAASTSTATTADSTAAATLGDSERAGKRSKEPKQKKRTATVAATSPLTGVVVGGESSAPAEQLPRRLSRHGSLRQILSNSVRSFR